MIKTENLTKVYSSGTKAVDGLTFEVMPGEIFGFLGPNGAGKSTTLKILTTLSKPTSGFAWVNGHDVARDPVAVRRSLGYVAQESGVDWFMTGRENLDLQGHLYRMTGKDIDRRIGELLDLFDLAKDADRLVSEWSGGMRRKLDIATALIHNPTVLFLDEPTLGLDPHSRSGLWNYIRALNETLKVTIFLTTHYLDEADRLSHRIGILHRGAVKIIGTPDVLKNSIRGDSVNLLVDSMHKDRATTILKTHPLVKELLPEGEHLRVYVDRGSEAIPILMAVLSEQGITVSTVTLSRPTLDDVYLKYSGVSFKEGEGGEVTNPWWEKWQKGSGGGSNKWWKGEQEDTETPNEEAVKAVEGESQRSDQAAWPENGGNGSAAKPAWEESSPKDWQKWQAASSVSDDGEKPVVEGEKEPDWKQWQAQWGKKDG